MPLSVQGGTTTRVSVASDGTQGNASCTGQPSISADGRYVAFSSESNNLVSDDTNGKWDVFVHDRQTNETTRVSVASDGTQGNGISSGSPSISADGRYVAFISSASNLVNDDTNDTFDVFVHDRQTKETTRVSVASDGTQANGSSLGQPSISDDGRYVAFYSVADNIVSGDTNGYADVFVHDRQTNESTRVSVASDGTQGNGDPSDPSISADGRFVAFNSAANNLLIGDNNGTRDIFVHDRQTNETTRVSVASDGTQGNGDSTGQPSISDDGRYVAFGSGSNNLVINDTNGQWDIFVHDRQTNETTLVSMASDGTQGNNSSHGDPSISDDGRFVAFLSFASNLVSDDTNGNYDVFVHDRQTGKTTRVSEASDGTPGNYRSIDPAISEDGHYIAFTSDANNLVTGDTNGTTDIFVHEVSAIKINPDPNSINAPWTLTGPDSYNQSGVGDHTLISPPVGDYTLTWGDILGWLKPIPVSEMKAVIDGVTTTFSGTYVQQTTPVIQVTPSSLNFGYVPAGSTKDLILTVKNVGVGTLIGSASTSAPFIIQSGSSYSLSSGEFQQVTVRYTPTQMGVNTGTVVFTNGGDATILVTGKTEKSLGLPWLMLLLGN